MKIILSSFPFIPEPKAPSRPYKFKWVFCYVSGWMGFPGGSSVKNLPLNARYRCWIPGLGRSPQGGHGNPLQCSCLESPMDRRAWRAVVHGVTKSWTWPKQLIIHAGKAMVFPVAMYGCEYWTIKKAEHQRTDALNCGIGEDSWESLQLQQDQTSQS